MPFHEISRQNKKEDSNSPEILEQIFLNPSMGQLILVIENASVLDKYLMRRNLQLRNN